MENLQKIKGSRTDIFTIVSKCLTLSVHNFDEITDRIMQDEMILCLSPTGFWLFSKENDTFIIEAVQGVRLINTKYRKLLEGLATENGCSVLWCQSRNWNVVHLLIRLGFSIVGVEDSHIQLQRKISNGFAT